MKNLKNSKKKKKKKKKKKRKIKKEIESQKGYIDKFVQLIK
jgi:hypothetical protein